MTRKAAAIGRPNGTGEVARRALAGLTGTPLRITTQTRQDLAALLEKSDEEALLMECHALVSLARRLFETGQPDAADDVLQIANTATARLERRNNGLVQTLDESQRETVRLLGVRDVAKRAPRMGEGADPGSISVASLSSRLPRKS